MTKNKTDIEVNTIYTETAKSCVDKIAVFLRSKNLEPLPILTATTQEFEDKVKVFPTGCPISSQLSKIGCTKYRECNTGNGYRILYSLNDEQTEVTVHIIQSQREDIQQLLFDRMIER